MSDPATPYQTGEPGRGTPVPSETPYPAPDSAIDRPLDDDWEPEFDELPVRPRRRWLTPVNLGLMAVLLVAAGFVGGVLVEKGQTSSSSGSGASALAALARRAGATGTGTTGSATGGSGLRSFLGGSGATSANLTTGTVSFVSHGKVYITDSEGNTVEATLASGGTVTRDDVSSVKDIHPGDTVIVSGPKSSSGTVQATSIRATSAAAASSGSSGLASLFGGGSGGGLFGGSSGAGTSGSGSSGAGASGSGSSAAPSLFGSG